MRQRRRRARSQRRAGFTLLELMVALAIGTLVVATMYTLSGSSSRAFQTQQRISQLQLQTRLAMERIRRDVAGAGFGASPDTARERTCGAPGVLTRMTAVGLTNQDPVASSALGAMAGAGSATTHGDRLRLMGNFATSDTYLIANTGSANGASIILQSDRQSFRRSFAADPLGATVDTNLFQEVFQPGRLVHITHPRGFHYFTIVQSSSVDSAGRTPSVSISPPLPTLDECNFALCVGCQVSPVMMIEYGIDTAQNIAAALVPRDEPVTGTNTVLYRRELNPQSLAVIGQPRAVLEFAVHFDVGAVVDAAVPGQPPNLAASAQAPLATIPVNQEGRVRALRIELAARTAETDPMYPNPYASGTRALTEPLTSFPVFTDRPGTARTRTVVAEFVLENLVIRGL